MFFGFFFIALTMRALHIFLASSMGIIILVFVSPVIIPMALFKQTNDIFKKWVGELIGYSLQPMILFAYVAFFITIMDKTMIGSATFSGEAPYKSISCDKFCKNSDGSIEPYVNGNFPPCTDDGDLVVNPMNDSVACIINLNDFGKMPGLEMFGLTLPILANFFEDNIQAKLLTILKAMIVMYLLYKFMDEIPGIGERLVGGSKLPTSTNDPIAMMKKLRGALAAMQERAVGGTKKLGMAAMKKSKQAARDIGSKGKASGGGDEGEDGGGDKSASSSEGDSGGSSSDGDGGGSSTEKDSS